MKEPHATAAGSSGLCNGCEALRTWSTIGPTATGRGREHDPGRWLAGRVATSAATVVLIGTVAGLVTWVGAAITGALSLPTLLAAGLNVVPTAIVVLGIGTLAHGRAPRSAAAVAYGLVAWSLLVEVIGASVGASHWLLDASVLHHVARAPSYDVRWDSFAVLVAIGIVTAAVGTWRFAGRDLAGA